MRVLFLTKQQYMSKDLLRDRFGRFYELPKALAALGCEIRAVCLKYWNDKSPSTTVDRQCLDGVDWCSFRLGWNWPAGFWWHLRRVNQIAAEFKPEVVLGASDALHAIMAASVSMKCGIPLVLDLYDDFESYGATRLPGITERMREATRQAAAISTVSDNLAVKVRDQYGARGIIRTIGNGICPEIFYSRNKISARQKLGLPERGLLIGTAGALNVSRDIGVLLESFENISNRTKDCVLVLAGPLERSLKLPRNDRIRYLGELPQIDVGDLFSALDIGVVCNGRNQFAEYCFPQKFYEMVACDLPIVAADVGAMRALLTGYEDCLYDAGQPASLYSAILRQLGAPHLVRLVVPSWKDRGVAFRELLDCAMSDFSTKHRIAGKIGASGPVSNQLC